MSDDWHLCKQHAETPTEKKNRKITFIVEREKNELNKNKKGQNTCHIWNGLLSPIRKSDDLIKNSIGFCANGYTKRIRDSGQMDMGQTRSILCIDWKRILRVISSILFLPFPLSSISLFDSIEKKNWTAIEVNRLHRNEFSSHSSQYWR